jgi:DNA-binding ferritin-like protein
LQEYRRPGIAERNFLQHTIQAKIAVFIIEGYDGDTMGYSASESESHRISGTRSAVCCLLNQQIIDTVDLWSKAKKAAAAVKARPSIVELNLLFEGVARDLTETINVIAGRIVALGEQECATTRMVAQQPSCPVDNSINAREYLQSLLSDYSKYDSASRRTMKAVKALGDVETQALLEQICIAIERNLWLLETHLEAIAVGLHGRKLPQWTPAFENYFRNIQRNQRICSHGI